MKKARLLAVILVLAMLVQIMPVMTLGVSAAANDTIVLYPEFPEEIKRDNMYHVYISQGGEEYELPVYNSMTHSNYNVRDQYGTYSEADRRFCQFSATPSEDNPVTIKVVSNADFSKVSVIPSIKGIIPTVSSNVITFNITEAGQYMFRLNDNNLTNLAIFADEVETHSSVDALATAKKSEGYTVVRYNASNTAPNKVSQTGKIFYIVEGWQDVEFFELKSNQGLYIAPGAVLNSRIQIMQAQSNITISGRGMLRDFNDSRAYNSDLLATRNYNYLLTVGSNWVGISNLSSSTNVVKNVTIEDIILYDATGFNLVFQGAVDCTADGIKVVSNEISTDGVSVWSSKNITVKNSYLYVADNIFVIDQSNTLTLDNLLVGSSIATFFPQGEIRGTHKYTNINVFRSTTFFEPTGGFSRPSWESSEVVLIENLSAIDCVAPVGATSTSTMGKLFSTFDTWGYTDKKNVTFRNVTLPSGTNPRTVSISFRGSTTTATTAGNYNIVLENVYADNGNGGFDLLTYDATNTANNNVTFNNLSKNANASTLTAGANNSISYTPITRSVTNASYTAYKTYIGRNNWTGSLYYSPTEPYVKNSVVYISAKTLAEKFGFNTYFDEDDKSLTIYDEDVLLRATVGSDVALYNDTAVTLSAAVEYGEEVMVPTDFFSKTLGISVARDSKKITIGNYDRAENIAINGDFENEDALESWDTVNFARFVRYSDGGNYVMRFADKSIFDVEGLNAFQGTYQDVRDTVLQNGTGVYRITFRAKCNEDTYDLTDTSNYYIFATLANGWMNESSTNGATKKALTNTWTEYTQDIVISESSTTSVYNKAIYLAIIINGKMDVSIDDITLTKISAVPSATATNTLKLSDNTTTVNYGSSKTLTVSGTSASSRTLSTTSDYLTITQSGSSATVSVKYPSNYARTARIVAKDSSGNVVGNLVITIPATSTDKHVVDFDTDLSINSSYEVGDTLDTSSFNLTNVLYNDGTTGTVNGASATVTGADFSTEGKKTVTVTYDNKTVTYTTTVGDVSTEDPEEPVDPENPTDPDTPTVTYEELEVELTTDNVTVEKYYPATSYRSTVTSEFKNLDRLLDGDQTTYGFYNNYKGEITKLDHYLEVIIDLGEEKDISKINFYAGSTEWSYPSPVNPEILVAGEDEVYTSVYTYECSALETTRLDCALLDHTTTGSNVRYIKYRYDTIVRNSTLAEIEVYEMITLGGEDPDTPTDPEEPTPPNEANLVSLGASIRIASDELSAGLRFGAKFSKNELYDTYYPTTDEMKKYKYDESNNFQFGVIMLPADLIPEGETIISLYQSGDSKIVDVPGKKIYEEDAESITFTGVLTGIPENFDGYTREIRTAFYVKVRESVDGEWRYIFSTELEGSYYSVAVKAAEQRYNYSNMPIPTEEEKATIDALNDIINFVEEDLWIDGKWW